MRALAHFHFPRRLTNFVNSDLTKNEFTKTQMLSKYIVVIFKSHSNQKPNSEAYADTNRKSALSFVILNK